MKSIRLFLWVCGSMIMFLAGLELLKAHSIALALPFAASWALLTAAILAGTRASRQSLAGRTPLHTRPAAVSKAGTSPD